MAADPQRWTMDVEEYLRLDEASLDVRYEYLDGQIYAMAGGTADHSTIKINITALFRRLLRRGPCRVYDTDRRVQLSRKRYVYPDASITCDPADFPGASQT